MGLYLAEVRKLTSVRATWILTVLGLAFVALFASLEIFGPFASDFEGSPSQLAGAMGAIPGSSALPLVVALLAMTTEFRHGTIGRTLQLAPSRTKVLVAKLVACALYGTVFVVLGTAVVGIVVLLAAQGAGVGLTIDGQVGEALWQGLVAVVLTALLGVAFGAVVRAQVIAITIALVWIFLVEGLVAAFWSSVGRWLPFQALNNLFVSDDMAGAAAAAGNPMVDALDPAVAFGVFTAWLVAFSVGAIASMRYRDV